MTTFSRNQISDHPKQAVRNSVRSLEALGAKLIGTVMKRVKVSKGAYYQCHY